MKSICVCVFFYFKISESLVREGLVWKIKVEECCLGKSVMASGGRKLQFWVEAYEAPHAWPLCL